MKRLALGITLTLAAVHGSTFTVQGSRLAVQGSAEPRVLRVGVLKSGGGYAVTDMPMETYVARVLAGESLRDSQPAALEALAITIRTFALANRGRHRADGFDLCEQTPCQVLRTAVARFALAAPDAELHDSSIEKSPFGGMWRATREARIKSPAPPLEARQSCGARRKNCSSTRFEAGVALSG